MLAHAEDLDVLDNDHLVVALLEDGAIDDIAHVLLVPLCEEEHRLGVPLRGGQQALAVSVLAHALEYRPHGAAHARQPLVRLLLGLLQPLARAGTGPRQPVEVDHGARRPRHRPAGGDDCAACGRGGGGDGSLGGGGGIRMRGLLGLLLLGAVGDISGVSRGGADAVSPLVGAVDLVMFALLVGGSLLARVVRVAPPARR